MMLGVFERAFYGKALGFWLTGGDNGPIIPLSHVWLAGMF